MNPDEAQICETSSPGLHSASLIRFGSVHTTLLARSTWVTRYTVVVRVVSALVCCAPAGRRSEELVESRDLSNAPPFSSVVLRGTSPNVSRVKVSVVSVCRYRAVSPCLCPLSLLTNPPTQCVTLSCVLRSCSMRGRRPYTRKHSFMSKAMTVMRDVGKL